MRHYAPALRSAHGDLQSTTWAYGSVSGIWGSLARRGSSPRRRCLRRQVRDPRWVHSSLLCSYFRSSLPAAGCLFRNICCRGGRRRSRPTSGVPVTFIDDQASARREPVFLRLAHAPRGYDALFVRSARHAGYATGTRSPGVMHSQMRLSRYLSAHLCMATASAPSTSGDEMRYLS